MAFKYVKKALRYAREYNCTVDMLYLDDTGIVVKSMDDFIGYNGHVSSCIDITETLCEKYRPVKVARILHEKYGMSMSHTHRCIAIHLGGLGTMDDEYIKKYPESNLSSLGMLSMEYSIAVKNTMALATLVTFVKLPHYNLDSFSVVHQCDSSTRLDLNEIFDNAQEWVELMLQYSRTSSIFATYNGDTDQIRRRISTTFTNIPKRYVEYNPKAMDKDGVVMARWNNKDFKVYHDKFIFDCDGKDLDSVNMYADQVMSAFGISKQSIVFSYQANTKASLRVDINNWNAIVLEDIIVNDSMLSRIMSVANGVLDDVITEQVFSKNRSLVIHVTQPRARCAFRYNNGTLKISVASLSVDDTAIAISVAIVWGLLRIYDERFANIYKKYSLSVKNSRQRVTNTKHRSKINDLRDRFPELFANNYTRECHNLPLMLDTEEEANKYREMGRLVIKYPLKGKYSKWYTSPSDDLYVGLKLNRLSNKDKFKYIVNCYTSNHYETPSRETYVYYHGDNGSKKESAANLITLKILAPGRRGPLPIAMTVEYNLDGYMRIGTGGLFVQCIATALGVDPRDYPKMVHKGIKNGLLNVVKQEAWNKSDDEILKDVIKNPDGKYYRLLEELYECNILLVEIGHRAKYVISIPSCKDKYIWEPRDGKYIVVMKNQKKLYDDHLVSYELVVNGSKSTFNKKDPLVSAIVSFKLAHTMRSDVDEKGVKAQYITEHGKCNIVMTKHGMTKCNSRPLYKPTISADVIKRQSKIYNYLGNISSATTAKHLYFPNNTSFMDWWTRWL
jgi:hypothetical protein